MKCSYHPEREAVGKCIDCGKDICRLCLTTTAYMIDAAHLIDESRLDVSIHHCPRCIDKILQKISPETFKYTFTPEGTVTGEVPVDMYYKMQNDVSESKARLKQAEEDLNNVLQGKRDYKKEFMQDTAVEESLTKYHSEILQGVRCPRCGEKTLYRCDDRKIRCKSCGETRPI